MRSFARKLARRSSCLMAVWPTDRVSWVSPLHPGSGPWPSTVMRNFATEPAAWHDLGIQQQQIGDNDDASFFIDFEWNYDGAPANNAFILYPSPPPSGRYGVYAASTGAVIATTNVLGATYLPINVRNSGYPLSRGRHTIRLRVLGTTFYAQLDNEAEKSTTGTRKTTTPTFVAPSSTADMSIYNMWLRNDTTGKTVWAYPSFAEKVRLVQTMDNVLTSTGVFEGATDGVVRRIKTALDLRGNSTSKTMVCRCYIPSHIGSNALWLSGLITQGYYSLGAVNQQVFNFSTWEDRRSGGQLRLYVTFAGSTAIKGTTFLVDGYSLFDRWVTLAAIYDYMAGTVSAYIGGVKIGSFAVVMEPFRLGAGSSLSDAVSVLHDASVGTASGHKIAWAQVHEGVLPQSTIAKCVA